MNTKKWFKCPICGGNIMKPIIENKDARIISNIINEQPTCSKCLKKWVIKISPDLSYEFELINSDY